MLHPLEPRAMPHKEVVSHLTKLYIRQQTYMEDSGSVQIAQCFISVFEHSHFIR